MIRPSSRFATLLCAWVLHAGVVHAAAVRLVIPDPPTKGAEVKPATAATSFGPLSPGDPAPGLFLSRWIQGEPMESVPPGSVTVVVFWASWCDASQSAIPTLNSAQRESAKLGTRVVAISARDAEGESPASVQALLQAGTAKPEFSVAFDERRRTTHAWLDAADQEYIPTAFIVDRSAKIAWIGSPLWPPGEFQEALAATVAGEFGPAQRKKLHERWENFVGRVRTLEADAQLARLNGRVEDASRLYDELTSLNTRNAPAYVLAKFEMLLTPPNEDKAYEFARGAITGPLRDDATALNEVAWSILDTDGLTKRDFKLALLAAQRAAELSHEQDAAILDTTARAYQCLGDLNRAIAFQARAVELAGDDPDHEDYATRLAEYRQAKAREAR